ncbi:diphosphate--fructose-6-phosphate 1-phosphotransferase [Clostridiales bacterium COT073_COT-073]|nr:diphosphate--fructose-6-phosphate 1-phosphotransferase [Clostridiales bacterium COT073_COT-073]
MANNLLIVHGGGPSAVINCSLYGVIKQAKREEGIDNIYAANGGMSAIFREDFIDLREISEDDLDNLLQTPGSAIGTSRDPMEKEDYEKLLPIFKKHEIKYVLLNGGNGTMDTCGKIYQECAAAGIMVMGIPKTMDNDLAVIDHSPGFASAARYMAESVKEVAFDVKGLAIHVVVIEALGRNAGWITAASAYARQENGDGPDMILLPEVPFEEEEFLAKVKALYDQKKGVVVVASEGLRYADGTPITPPIFQTGRSVYFGDVSAHLATLITKKLGIKARSEKPGLLGRASMKLRSQIDIEEAIRVGEEAVKAAVSGETGKMVGIRRLADQPYQAEIFLVPIDQVMMAEKKMPADYYTKYDVTPAFLEWLSPLMGGELPRMVSFRK